MLLEIKINVDEMKYKNIIEKELNAFSKDELHEIIREGIIETLHQDDILKKLFTVEDRDHWGYSTGIKPSEIVIQAAKSIDLAPAYKEIQDNMITTLKENYHELLERTMLSLIKEGLTGDCFWRERLADDIDYIVTERLNKT